MTIEQLRARRRELLERKQYELDLQAQGKGDNMALFMVNEELLDVGAQIRALEPIKRVRSYAGTVSERGAEKQIYRRWVEGSSDGNEGLDERRRIFVKTMQDIAGNLTEYQSRVMTLWMSGRTMNSIADELGVNKATISRTIARAKNHMKEEAERRIKLIGIEDATHIDLSDPYIAQVVISCLTDKQAVYIYLYYGEWLSTREIEELVGADHSSICRTIGRGLEKISSSLNTKTIVFEHMETFGDLAYQVYLDQGGIAEAEGWISRTANVDMSQRNWGKRCLAQKRGQIYWKNKYQEYRPKAQVLIRNAAGNEEMWGSNNHYRGNPRKSGKLLEALREIQQKLSREGKSAQLINWLQHLFGHVIRRGKYRT